MQAGAQGSGPLGAPDLSEGAFLPPVWPGPGFLGLCPQSQGELLNYAATWALGAGCLEGLQDWAEGLGWSLSCQRREGDWHPRLDLRCVLLAPTRP